MTLQHGAEEITAEKLFFGCGELFKKGLLTIVATVALIGLIQRIVHFVGLNDLDRNLMGMNKILCNIYCMTSFSHWEIEEYIMQLFLKHVLVCSQYKDAL